MSHSPRTWGRKSSFLVAAAVVVHTLWTSAAPAMMYPLYARQWQLTPTITTLIFAVFPVFVVATLIALGDLSDYIGRRAAMLLGLSASLIGVLLFAVAPNVLWLLVGRAFMGIGVGLSAGPSAAAVVEFSAPGKAKLAGAITTAAQAFGLAAALILGGGLIQYAPFPTRLSFWVLVLVLVATLYGVWHLPRHTKAQSRKRWTLKLPRIHPPLRQAFLVSVSAVLSAYSVGATMLSLGSQIAHDLIGSNNALVNGCAISLFAIVLGLTGIVAKRFTSMLSIIAGASFSIASLVLLMLATATHALPVFLLSSATSGAGYSLLFMGGLNLINAHAPMHHRAGTLSALFLVAYLMQGVVAMLLGRAATAWGLDLAIDVGSVALAGLSLGAMLLAIYVRPRQVNR
ncbi:MFS transporter [Pseudomonas bohemica]|uniref:MFS transporter n=1 Tax=Pseudomonas bohemica TaxID=2044872 RepID=UPI000DA61AAF|nr:MFS transporter [Pseudomonas bohemica]